MQAAAGAFALGSYVAAFRFSIAAERSVLPYGLLIGLHFCAALWLTAQGYNTGGHDAAGNGLQTGLLWLGWLAASIGFGCVTWLVFLGARLLR